MTEGARAGQPLCDAVLDLLASGVIMSIATRDASLAPECAPAMGSRVHKDRKTLTVFVPESLAGITLANIANNGRVAMSITRPTNTVSMQIKGHAVAVRDAVAADAAVQEQYRGALVEQLAMVGLPRAVTRRLRWSPSVAIEVAVEEVFVQTPGPGAGRPLAAASASAPRRP
jgi:predicted pyridoxine 5'-phosphate oxidase superfamily flavin-nucleotide-binding protein